MSAREKGEGRRWSTTALPKVVTYWVTVITTLS